MEEAEPEAEAGSSEASWSESSCCLVAHSARPRIWRDSAVLECEKVLELGFHILDLVTKFLCFFLLADHKIT
jgi:hypothetical protein